MDRTSNGSDVQTTYGSTATHLASMTGRSYAQSHESSANAAANETLGGCEQESSDRDPPETKLTEVDALLAIEIWKPAEPQYCRAICAQYGVHNRTVQKWFDKIVAACPWFSVAELRLPDDRYAPLCVELMGDYRASGLIARKWGEKMAERFADRIAAASTSPSELPASSKSLHTEQPTEPSESPALPDPHASQPLTEQSRAAAQPPVTSRLNLPTIPAVNGLVVPSSQSLPTDTTDTHEAKTLAATGKQAIEQNSQDLSQIRVLLQQVNAFVDGKIAQLDSETEQTQQQVRELQDLAFQLETKQETLRRAEVRNAAARQESESAKAAATNKVINLSDFFAAKSQSPQGG